MELRIIGCSIGSDKKQAMKYRSEIKITRYFHDNVEINVDEYVIRELARKIVKDLPIDYLSKFINVVKIDPDSEESKDKLNDFFTKPHEREFINHLKDQGAIIYQSEINIEK